MIDNVKEQFSEDEWFLIASVPSMVGAAMAGAGKSGIIGTTKEAMASMKTLVAGKNQFPQNEVIEAILQKAESFSEAKDKAGVYREKALSELKSREIKSPDEFNSYMLENCKKAISLVKERRSPEEAAQYRQWSMQIAEGVAKAASEGGFLGFGGEQVSDGEKQLLAQIDSVFNSIG